MVTLKRLVRYTFYFIMFWPLLPFIISMGIFWLWHWSNDTLDEYYSGL